ncbi:MAG: hypothetical protein GXO86_10540 [Chlorobi bacterium]|nr:hypothetical protein [Chlorobiota bacterium]
MAKAGLIFLFNHGASRRIALQKAPCKMQWRDILLWFLSRAKCNAGIFYFAFKLFWFTSTGAKNYLPLEILFCFLPCPRLNEQESPGT